MIWHTPPGGAEESSLLRKEFIYQHMPPRGSEVGDSLRRQDIVREAVAVKEKEVRASLLEIATRAAHAERNLVSRKLHDEASRLGTLTFGSAKSMGG